MLGWDCDFMVWAVGLLTVLFAYGKWQMGIFKWRGACSAPGMMPFIGHLYNVLAGKETFKDTIINTYNSSKDQKYVGFMVMTNPILMIRDIDLIKKMAIRDFDHFQDHVGIIDEKADPLFGNNLFALRGQKWKDMRATLSPAFTISKMRNMFSLMDDCGTQMVDYYTKEINKQNDSERGSVLSVEMKDAFTRYANDVIASTAFGIQVNSLDERNNEFYRMGKQCTDLSGIKQLKYFAYSSFPNFMKFFKIKFFTDKVTKFFKSIISDTIKDRELKGIVRPDMIQLLMEAKRGSLKHDANIEIKNKEFAIVEESSMGNTSHMRELSDDDITSQAVLFFIAGFESSSTLMTYMSYELAVNPDIQKRLQSEVDGVLKKTGGILNYNELQGMKYMDMVVSETLRLWPPGIATDRICVKPYTMPSDNDSSDKRYSVNVGEVIWIPVFAIHHDPTYYPDPEKFDPERFSEENKDSIIPNTYIPFGVGPRNCIGSRFALMEAKIVIFHMLARFNLLVIDKTQIPIQLKKRTFTLDAENGIWIGLKTRTNKNL